MFLHKEYDKMSLVGKQCSFSFKNVYQPNLGTYCPKQGEGALPSFCFIRWKMNNIFEKYCKNALTFEKIYDTI